MLVKHINQSSFAALMTDAGMDTIKELVAQYGCYFRGKNQKVPLGYFLNIPGLGNRLKAPIEYLTSDHLFFHEFEILFPPEMQARHYIHDIGLFKNAMEGISLEAAISELERNGPFLKLAGRRGFDGIEPILGLPYKGKTHTEPSYYILCEHGNASDVRFHRFSFVRENACGECSETEEYEKSLKFAETGMNLVNKLRLIHDGAYEQYDIDALIARHNKLTSDIHAAKRG
jgi:hypothetical protein